MLLPKTRHAPAAANRGPQGPRPLSHEAGQAAARSLRIKMDRLHTNKKNQGKPPPTRRRDPNSSSGSCRIADSCAARNGLPPLSTSVATSSR